MSVARLRRLFVPRSLRGKFSLALSAMALLIVVGGIAAVQALHVSADASRNLAEEHLECMQDAQNLLQRTLLIERQSRHLQTAGSLDVLQGSYAEIITLLDSFDILAAHLSQANSDVAVLDLHQASQLFRNTVHVVARLRNEDLSPNAANQLSSEQQQTLHHFEGEQKHQVEALAAAAEDLSGHITADYREAVLQLASATRHRQQLVLTLLVGNLLLAWLISRYFRNHAVNRLQQVSHYLRLGEPGEDRILIPVQGDDEIGEMARAVEQFLEDRQRLVETQSNLQQSEEMMRAITNAVQSAVLLIDEEDRIRFANPAVEKLFGYSQEELGGCKVHETLIPESLQQRARDGLAAFAQIGGLVLENPQELIARRKDGSEVFIELYVGRVRREDHWWAVGAAIDISLHKSREQLLASLAETDQLTGIGNRRSFLRLAEAELKRCHHAGLPLFFLMFDLDHFKAVNDRYGHAAGDEILRKFAAICTGNLRDTDLFGRIGGEEFAAVMTGKGLQNVLGVAERIRMAFIGVTIPVGEQSLEIDTSVSIGLVRVDPAQDTVESGLKKADAALYLAKTQGRNRVVTRDYEEGE
ncbi:MAG: sensor domain-containing diguanylate cyclase [Desulfoprunum sp.]|nr:sensor domain-containing diguanylate cyclase [Desulfoprunum sp.]